MESSGLRRRRQISAGVPLGIEDAEQRVSPEEAAVAHGESEEASGANVAAISPFWSERMQLEARLQAARPASLDAASAAITSGQDSSSTELRPADVEHPSHPAGHPRSFGPAAMSSTPLETMRDGAALPFLSGAAGEQVADQEQGDHGEEGSEPVRAGMRPGERRVVEEMRDILRDLIDQNTQILRENRIVRERLDRLEDDQMRSASSGGHRDLVKGVQEFIETADSFPRTSGLGDEGVFLRDETESSRVLRAVRPLELPGRARASDEVQIAAAVPARTVREQSPPPPPPPELKVHPRPCTPGGTVIPEEEPPRTPTPTGVEQPLCASARE